MRSPAGSGSWCWGLGLALASGFSGLAGNVSPGVAGLPSCCGGLALAWSRAWIRA